jgi:hypothetical protein
MSDTQAPARQRWLELAGEKRDRRTLVKLGMEGVDFLEEGAKTFVHVAAADDPALRPRDAPAILRSVVELANAIARAKHIDHGAVAVTGSGHWQRPDVPGQAGRSPILSPNSTSHSLRSGTVDLGGDDPWRRAAEAAALHPRLGEAIRIFGSMEPSPAMAFLVLDQVALVLTGDRSHTPLLRDELGKDRYAAFTEATCDPRSAGRKSRHANKHVPGPLPDSWKGRRVAMEVARDALALCIRRVLAGAPPP